MDEVERTRRNKFIRCPHCHLSFRQDDMVSPPDKGNLKCRLCGKKFPSPLPEHKYVAPSASPGKYRAPVYIALAAFVALISIYYFLSAAKMTPDSVPSSSPESLTETEKAAPAQGQATSGKLQTIERIASDFRKNHTYTVEQDFVCMDMAISIWNQLVTNGIEAQIMGGNVKEDITGWDYRQLVIRSDHAWVVAQISPARKVAVETTAGAVIKSNAGNAAPYFRGIVFDNPGQIKKFDFLRRRANEVCRDAKQMIDDWNNNFAGKMQRSDAANSRLSRIEQRKQDCENTFIELEEFRARAIFY